MLKKITLSRLKNTEFPTIYNQLLLSDELNESQLKTILALSMAFIKFQNKEINDLGYRLILLYSRKTRDYKPLYEISQNNGLIPISKYIYSFLGYGDKYGNLQTEINDIQNNKYQINNVYRTKEQKNLIDFTYENQQRSKVIIAPTSYGKTELIIDMIQKNENYNICIVTPSKSLLAQTKRRIMKVIGNKKIITQPEMYSESEDRVVAVLTQERLLRLLQLHKELSFDMLIIDEAHNLLEKSQKDSKRSILLASVIILCFSKNNNLICNFVTPFMKSLDNLKVKYTNIDFVSHIVTEFVKSELFYFHDIREGKEELYDQYMNNFIPTKNNSRYQTDSELILAKADEKNIIYLNKPKDLEKFAEELSQNKNIIESPIIKKAVSDLKNFIHPEYNLARFLEHGVIYHHGAVPESVRFFIEDLYVNNPELKFLIANSTLLEGVNIPATKMFILDPFKGRGYMNPSSFKNLIGRICRFSEIFDDERGNLDYLLPEVHILKGQYCFKDFTPKGFIRKTKCSVIADFDDVNENPLLENSISDAEEITDANEFIENISDNSIVDIPSTRKVNTFFGKLCFQNNINIFDIVTHEEEITAEINDLSYIATDLNIVFDLLNYIFFKRMSEEINSNSNIRRLQDVKARNFYKMILNWRMLGMKTSDMVLQMLAYWQTLENDELTYVGRWGDEKRGGFRELWTIVANKSNSEKVNLAIVRLKEEFDFIDNEIIKYIEVLYQLELLEEELYLKLKYGTSDADKIALINCGISNYLSDLLREKYSDFFQINLEENNVTFNKQIIEAMENEKENGVLITEVKINSNL
ncbi:hypothetical protein I580_00361 [Enterococcus caccae ATCC BAA-1240]|uniref:Helicase ATP-binding domain-containing protein n=1 Tax=Enterococcus caccae ATCC BAA-1240 TaxID=1158612 RepID=R3W774_9ENTE|nr:hypothetical protein UC7_02951 [Enterococcus caccae ATCC BAA-1240]EOT67979.1 hypothetical protein I580_00361 [Enterococcus caccae ATCC BAA-1240]